MVAKYSKVCQLTISCVSHEVHVIHSSGFVVTDAQTISHRHWMVVSIPLIGWSYQYHCM